MLKKQKKLLKAIIILVAFGISSTLIFHSLSPSFTSTWVEEKIFQKEITTIDPWIQKRWQHVKIISDVRTRVQVTKTILLWTKFFGASDYLPKLSDICPVPKCFVTSNRDYLNKSDAVLFHLRDTSLNDIPSRRTFSQIWILLHHEAPPHTPDILNNLHDVFNWTATYRFKSEIFLTPIVKKRKQKLIINKNYAKGKSKLIAWFVSNCKTLSNREGYVRELQKFINVDIYGKCGKLTCLPKMSDECYVKIASKYRFYLAFENSICKDYVTEKLFHVLSTDMIPVVLGGANYSIVAPPFSYINALDFKSPKDLAQYLFQVAKDEKLYNSYFEWKKSYEIVGEHYACKICQKLHKPVIYPTFYRNISSWWFGDANCRSWPF